MPVQIKARDAFPGLHFPLSFECVYKKGYTEESHGCYVETYAGHIFDAIHLSYSIKNTRIVQNEPKRPKDTHGTIVGME